MDPVLDIKSALCHVSKDRPCQLFLACLTFYTWSTESDLCPFSVCRHRIPSKLNMSIFSCGYRVYSASDSNREKSCSWRSWKQKEVLCLSFEVELSKFFFWKASMSGMFCYVKYLNRKPWRSESHWFTVNHTTWLVMHPFLKVIDCLNVSLMSPNSFSFLLFYLNGTAAVFLWLFVPLSLFVTLIRLFLSELVLLKLPQFVLLTVTKDFWTSCIGRLEEMMNEGRVWNVYSHF